MIPPQTYMLTIHNSPFLRICIKKISFPLTGLSHNVFKEKIVNSFLESSSNLSAEQACKKDESSQP